MRCIVCGGSSFKRSIYGGYCYRDKKYDIVRCRKCGFMFLSPQPGKDVLNSIYNADDYFKDYYATRAGLKNYIEGMSDFEGSDKTALSLILKIKKTGRLLDIGCAAGRFLNNARQVGFEVCGVEPNQKLADYAKKVYGLSVECATLDNAHLAKDSFDVIHAGDVLEHLPGLKENIDLIKSLLKRGGILFINQSFSYNKSFFNLCLKINMLFKKNRYSRNPPTHLWEFNPRTMKRFLRNNGFNIIYSKTAESAAPMPCGSKGTREVLRRYAKNISWSISNSPLLERLHLGDRGIIICKK